MSEKKTLILIDGHALAFRQYYALERTGMKNSENQPTWAVYGFFKAIFDLLARIKPDFIAVAFDVGRQTCTLTFNDLEESGIKAEFNFSVYTKKSVYPAYAFNSVTATLNNNNLFELSTDQVEALDAETADVYEDVIQFANVCKSGDVSIQLVTQNKSFSCHIIILEKETSNLLFMGMMYGY